MEENYQQQIN